MVIIQSFSLLATFCYLSRLVWNNSKVIFLSSNFLLYRWHDIFLISDISAFVLHWRPFTRHTDPICFWNWFSYASRAIAIPCLYCDDSLFSAHISMCLGVWHKKCHFTSITHVSFNHRPAWTDCNNSILPHNYRPHHAWWYRLLWSNGPAYDWDLSLSWPLPCVDCQPSVTVVEVRSQLRGSMFGWC